VWTEAVQPPRRLLRKAPLAERGRESTSRLNVHCGDARRWAAISTEGRGHVELCCSSFMR
jgi:hypothetical protein